MGQNLNRIPYKDTHSGRTTRTSAPKWNPEQTHSGIDFKQLKLFLTKLNENHLEKLWKAAGGAGGIVVKVLKVRDWYTRKSRDFNEECPRLQGFIQM